MPRIPYKYGQPVTPGEVDFVINNCVKQRRRGVSPAKIFKTLAAMNCNFVEHLINKARGFAFDSGEAGFAHQRID